MGSRSQSGDKRSGPRVRYVWSRNMHLRVAAPTTADWQLMEAGQHADGLLAAFRCMHGQPPRVLALNAYAHAVTAEHQHTVEQLCQQDWARRWQPSTFRSIDTLAVQVVERPGKGDQACEVLIDGQGGEPAQALRVREWHVPAGHRLLIASAAGSPELHERFATEIDMWLVYTELGA